MHRVVVVSSLFVVVCVLPSLVCGLCGNGVLEMGEVCERGGTFCTRNCTCIIGSVPTRPLSINCTLCGNGRIDSGEQCESNGTNCTSSCQCARGSFPSSPLSVNCTSTPPRPAECGNRIIEAGEECELGGFGCSSECRCVNNTVPLSPISVNCTQRVLCGDGLIEGNEECEIGGRNCLPNCTCDSGFFATLPVSINCIRVGPGCGNGVLEPGEQCELNGVNCRDNCTCLDGFSSTVPLSVNCLPPQFSNISLLLPCRNTTNESYTCIPGVEKEFLACHNGYLSFEECVVGTICNSSIGPIVPNATSYNPCTISNTSVCGNGLVEPGERCEIGGANCTKSCSCTMDTVATDPLSDSCTDNTAKPPTCGDGQIEESEECEVTSPTCSNKCTCLEGLVPTIPKSIHCTRVNSSNLFAVCKVVNTTAFACIENITRYYLRCSNSSSVPPTFFECPATSFCTTIGTFTASSPCTLPVSQSVCGNAIVEPGEECDGGENCSPRCTCFLGTVPTLPLSMNCIRGRNYNLVSECHNQSGLKCVPGLVQYYLSCAPPFSIALQMCPEGTICSAINFTQTSPCGLTSLVPLAPLAIRSLMASRRLLASQCGNGIVEQGEECDGGTGCTNCVCDSGFAPTGTESCKKLDIPNVCGNGILEGSEQCEVGGTSCGPDCKCLSNSQPTVPTSKNCETAGKIDLNMWCAGRSGLRCVAGVATQYLECAAPFFVGFRPCAPGTECLIDGFADFNPCILPPQVIIAPAPPPPAPYPLSKCERPDRDCQPGGKFCDPSCYCLPGCQPFFPRKPDCFPIPPPSLCGNGRVDPGEACDGGNLCSECSCISGSVPTLPPSASCSFCKNGILNRGEECDSGSLCTSACTCFPGAIPTSPPSLSCTFCGNNFIDFGEQCEAGGFGCSGCQCLPGFAPFFPPSRDCRLIPKCGNGIIDFGEECDSFVGCLPNCKCGPGFAPYSPPIPLCKQVACCGNFILEPGEECDGGFGCFGCQCAQGYRPTSPASLDCQPIEFCGDGIVSGNEECDSGFGCGSCRCLPGYIPAIPRQSYCIRLCGNNRIDLGEECDGGFGCTSACTCDASAGYKPAFPPQTSCEKTCGNCCVDPGEECDGGFGCDSSCHCITGNPSRAGFQPFFPPQRDCRANCGDFRLEVPEQCDSGFGCDSSCNCRPGFRPTGSILCIPNGCGNGVIDFGEECEPTGFGCRSWCQCANGFVPNSPARNDCIRV
ncbi:Fibro-slime domain protein [Pelomyxa schiedti]|nr:Fibro-slime domain protein [Pelomyxa schiedti]